VKSQIPSVYLSSYDKIYLIVLQLFMLINKRQSIYILHMNKLASRELNNKTTIEQNHCITLSPFILNW